MFGDDNLQEDDSPFERKITRMFSGALNQTRNSTIAALSDGTNAQFENSINDGVSANLCDAAEPLVNAATKTHHGSDQEFWCRALWRLVSTPDF